MPSHLSRFFAVALTSILAVAGCSSSDNAPAARTGEAPTTATLVADPFLYAPKEMCVIAQNAIEADAGEVAWEQDSSGSGPDDVHCTLTDPDEASTTIRLAVAHEMDLDDPAQCMSRATNPDVSLAGQREASVLCRGDGYVTFGYAGQFADGYASFDASVPAEGDGPSAGQLQAWLNAVQDGLIQAAHGDVTPAGPAGTGAGDDSDTDPLECDPDSAVDNAICDDLNDSANQSTTKVPCSLPDGSAVFTPAFADVAALPVRCQVPDEAGLFAALAAHGATIDGVADLGNEGDPDYNVFYVVQGCAGQPTYWPATENWSRYKGTSPTLTEERFASASALVDAICG